MMFLSIDTDADLWRLAVGEDRQGFFYRQGAANELKVSFITVFSYC